MDDLNMNSTKVDKFMEKRSGTAPVFFVQSESLWWCWLMKIQKIRIFIKLHPSPFGKVFYTQRKYSNELKYRRETCRSSISFRQYIWRCLYIPRELLAGLHLWGKWKISGQYILLHGWSSYWTLLAKGWIL